MNNMPQFLLVFLYALSLGIHILNHGKPIVINAKGALLSAAIVFSLLIWGGFFK